MQRSNNYFINHRLYPYLIILLASAFLFYKYILQVSPSIMIDELMREFHINATGMGDLTASFFYSLLVAQLFIGVLLDRFSPRILTTSAILLCAVGAFVFSHAETLLWAKCSRILMGLGAAFATVSYMKFARLWFKPSHLAFVSGLLASAAMLGAVVGQVPMSLLIINGVGWQSSMSLCAIVGMVLAALFYLIVRDRSPLQIQSAATINPVAAQFSFHDVWSVLKNKQNWLITLYSGLAFSPIDAFAGLWGIPFLKQGYLLTKIQAACSVSLIFLGLAIGSPLLGLLSDHLAKRRSVMLVSGYVAFLTITCIVYATHLPLWLLSSLLFLFGFSTGAFMLGFTIGSEVNKITVTATVVSLINTGDIVFSAMTDPLIGKFLDVGWSGKIIDDIHYFSLLEYRRALTVLPLYILLSIVLLFFIRESKMQKKIL